jgi:transcriptional regulator with XRE-family HTH domain
LHALDYQIFIELLVLARRNLHMTQRELAKRLNKPPSYVGKIEKCERRVDLIEFLAICAAMNVQPAEFLLHLQQKLLKVSDSLPFVET